MFFSSNIAMSLVKNSLFELKDGDEINVGNPLSKSFLNKINEGVMSSLPEKSAGLALRLYSNISYWENNEKRIK
jgi:hypothetical protein